MSSPLVISAANLDVLEKNMQVLSQNINSVTGDIIDINGQISSFNNDVNEIKSSVLSLEEEIKKFMQDIRNNTIVTNAQNDILIKEGELNKKYSYYDTVRIMTKGLLENIKHNFVSKTSLNSVAENVLTKAPNYYLSYVLIAISNWFSNDKDKAIKALNEALKLDERKTALLLCLIHLELGREKAAGVWLKYYFDKQNPKSLDSSFAFMLDAYASNIFSSSLNSIIKSNLDSYIKTLDVDIDIIDYQIKRWSYYFTSKKESASINSFPFINQYTNNINNVLTIASNSKTYYGIYYALNDLINNGVNKDKNIKTVISQLVDNYEDSEYNLKQSIIQNRLIIEADGDTNKAKGQFEFAVKAYSAQNDLYTIFINILLSTTKASTNTKKLAISYLKGIIKRSIEESIPIGDDILNNSLISIGDWQGYTSSGSNENDLKKEVKAFIDNKINNELAKYPLLNIKTLGALVLGLLGVVCSILINFAFGIALIVIGLIVGVIAINEILKKKDIIIKKFNEELDNYYFNLENIVAEIVDVYFMKKRAKDNYDFILRFLNRFDDSNF